MQPRLMGRPPVLQLFDHKPCFWPDDGARFDVYWWLNWLYYALHVITYYRDILLKNTNIKIMVVMSKIINKVSRVSKSVIMCLPCAGGLKQLIQSKSRFKLVVYMSCFYLWPVDPVWDQCSYLSSSSPSGRFTAQIPPVLFQTIAKFSGFTLN